ncbi:hypothetical protein D3C87_918830 [compost metagenome]
MITAVEGFLEVEQVRGGFEQRPRQLLQLRMAVHFQRIEFFIAETFGIDLLAAENPPLSFSVEAAQLIAHPFDGGFHLVQRDLRVVDLLFDPATEDRGFPGQIDQLIEQFGGDFDHVRASVGSWRRRVSLDRHR